MPCHLERRWREWRKDPLEPEAAIPFLFTGLLVGIGAGGGSFAAAAPGNWLLPVLAGLLFALLGVFMVAEAFSAMAGKGRR